MAKGFYQSEEVLLIVPQPRGEELRVMKGTRADGTVYLDVRMWYRDDFDELKPGKGLGKPDANGVWDAIARAILERGTGGQTKVYNPKTQKYEEEE